MLNRARKSFMVSVGLLLLGLIAILGAVVYRTSQATPDAQGGEYVITALEIPAGAEVVSAVAADGTLTVTYRLGAMTSVRIFDGRSGEMLHDIPVVSE